MLLCDDNADKVVQCVTDTFSERDGLEEPWRNYLNVTLAYDHNVHDAHNAHDAHNVVLCITNTFFFKYSWRGWKSCPVYVDGVDELEKNDSIVTLSYLKEAFNYIFLEMIAYLDLWVTSTST